MIKQFFKTVIPLILLLTVTLFIGSSCGEDDPTPLINCDVNGLYYTIDSGTQQFLPETHTGINTNSYTYSNSTLGNTLMIHQLGNGYLFQSNATDVDQVSSHVVGITTEGSQLELNLWANTDVVNINYTRKRLDDVINGVVYYTFDGNYTTAGITHQIEGYICVTLDVIN